MSEIEANAPFFDAIPYRPKYSAPFDQERLLLEVTLSVANRQYFLSDLNGYKKSVNRVGSYLEHALLKNEQEVRESDIWADYFHHKATIKAIFGQPASAACLNSEAKQLYSAKAGRQLDALSCEGCTMCCRVESISSDEQYLLSALDSQTEDLAHRLQNIPEEIRSEADEVDFQTRAFYIHILKCKIQAHMRHPDPDKLAKAISDAKACRKFITGQEESTYDVVVPFYEAYLSKINGKPVEHATNLYKDSLKATQKSNVPYFCLLRVPDHVSSALANHVRLPRLSSDSALSKLKQSKTIQFSVHVVTIFLLALIAPPLANEIFPFTQIASELTSSKAVWLFGFGFTTGTAAILVWARKWSAQKNDRGLVSPSHITAADITCWVYLAFSVTLLAAAATERLTL